MELSAINCKFQFFPFIFCFHYSFRPMQSFFLEFDGRKRHKFTKRWNFLLGGFDWTSSERCLPSTSETAASSSSTKTFKQTDITQRETKYINCVLVLKARCFLFKSKNLSFPRRCTVPLRQLDFEYYFSQVVFFISILIFYFFFGQVVGNCQSERFNICAVDFVRSVEQSSKRNEA